MMRTMIRALVGVLGITVILGCASALDSFEGPIVPLDLIAGDLLHLFALPLAFLDDSRGDPGDDLGFIEDRDLHFFAQASDGTV